MTQSFTCPSCGAPLDYEGGGQPTIPCPYCFSSVIVPQELRFQKAAPVSPQMTLSLKGQAPRLRELANLVRIGQKGEAIRIYQQIFAVSEPEAALAVDQLARGQAIVVAHSTQLGGSLPGIPVSPVSTNPANYTVQPPMRVYTNTTGQPQRSALMWIIFSFVGFMICITLVTTVLPFIIGLIALVPFFGR